ncbi:hypothetical protein F4780DRAFT_84207 [Xylariomycetidae sp. FL0641]|nr:hypothetical protein F4780DRAFT_84207 [Xylariomycetidae sp. FL0641]
MSPPMKTASESDESRSGKSNLRTTYWDWSLVLPSLVGNHRTACRHIPYCNTHLWPDISASETEILIPERPAVAYKTMLIWLTAASVNSLDLALEAAYYYLKYSCRSPCQLKLSPDHEPMICRQLRLSSLTPFSSTPSPVWSGPLRLGDISTCLPLSYSMHLPEAASYSVLEVPCMDRKLSSPRSISSYSSARSGRLILMYRNATRDPPVYLVLGLFFFFFSSWQRRVFLCVASWTNRHCLEATRRRGWLPVDLRVRRPGI